MEDKGISRAVIRRMPRYYRHLDELLLLGVERISSGDLSERMHVTASQIRQDLNNFGGFGQQGYGYNVRFLHDEIGKILGLNGEHRMIVIGSGHLGQALTNYSGFQNMGFQVVGLFDVDPSLKGKLVNGLPIRMIDELEEFIKTRQIDMAALTTPRSQAETMALTLAEFGIRGIWNFAHVDLDNLKGVTVENVHLSDSLLQLSFNMTQQENLNERK